MGRRRVVALGCGLLAIGLAQQVCYGKLTAFSPVLLGFSRHETARAVVYRQAGAGWPADIDLDGMIAEVERFHDLRFRRRPELVAFGDVASYRRRSLSRARFCAFSSGRLLISPWALREAAEGRLSLDIYLRHELSHVLIFQHRGFLAELRYPAWLLEGLAVYSTQQMGTTFYPSKADTYRLLRQGNYLPPRWFKTRREDSVPLRVPYRLGFIYSEFGCLVDYLQETHRPERLLAYMKRLLRDSDEERAFQAVYGYSFETCLERFRAQAEVAER